MERGVPGTLADGDAARSTYVDASYWRDMGTPETSFADRRIWCASPRLRPCVVTAVSSWCTTVRRYLPGALLIGGTVVGRGAEIGPGTRLDGAVLFDSVGVEAGCVIERSFRCSHRTAGVDHDGVIVTGPTSARAASC